MAQIILTLPSFEQRMLSAGYFPKELPPPFSTVSFATFASNNLQYIDDPWAPFGKQHYTTLLVRHNLARPGTNRRLLGIPNPINHLRLVRQLEPCLTDIYAITNASPFSSSKPSFNTSGRRAISPKYGSTLSEYKAKVRSGALYIVKVDIARCYPSIYTHSIPWALHTKPIAKSNRGRSLPGNILDKIIRENQDGQTIGLPIGPDTSFLLAELILSSIDARIGTDLAGRGSRWYDDFEVGFSDEMSANAFCAALELELSEYELETNPLKTEILRLPQPFNDAWYGPLHDFELKSQGKPQAASLIGLFNLAFTFYGTYPKSGVLKYAVKKLYKTVSHAGGERPVVQEFNWGLAQQLLAQVAVVEPDALPTVLGLISFYEAQGLNPDRKLLQDTLSRVIIQQSNRGFSSDVAWAIWGFIEHGITIPEAPAQVAANLVDDIVALLLLHATSIQLVDGSIDWSMVNLAVSTSNFESEHWLLGYEALKNSWLPSTVTDCLASNSHVTSLISGNVSFYRTQLRQYESARHIFGTPAWLLGEIPYE